MWVLLLVLLLLAVLIGIGLIAVAAGAGGHAGPQSPFALIQEIREWFDGPLLLSGAIATGRAVLAALPSAQVRALYPDRSAFVDRHGVGPRSLSALRVLLAETRQRGYATEDGEVTPGFASVAAPVRDHTGRPVAGAAVTFPGAQVDAAGREGLARLVTRAADELTRRIGGHPTTPRGATTEQGHRPGQTR